jgi:hypothetical protein
VYDFIYEAESALFNIKKLPLQLTQLNFYSMLNFFIASVDRLKLQSLNSTWQRLYLIALKKK